MNSAVSAFISGKLKPSAVAPSSITAGCSVAFFGLTCLFALTHVSTEALALNTLETRKPILKIGNSKDLNRQSLNSKNSNPYKTNKQIAQWIFEYTNENHQIARKKFIGNSTNGREIWAIEISVGSRPKPFIFINGSHHGNEKISTESAIRIAESFSRKNRSKSSTKILDHFNLLIQPVVNPDGYALGIRENALGIDINRDYPTGPTWKKGHGGKLRAKETRLVSALFDEFKFLASINLHSGSEAILWPLGSSPKLIKDHKLVNWLARRAAKKMGIKKSGPSYFDYPTNGEIIDFAYLVHGTLAFTFEISNKIRPPNHLIDTYARRARDGSIGLMLDLADILNSNSKKTDLPKVALRN